jgi:hypothetical protein
VEPKQLERLRDRTERYRVVLQSLLAPPSIDAEWVAGTDGSASRPAGPLSQLPG